MELSVLITSLPFSFDESLRALAGAGFRHVDLIGKAELSELERDTLADSGLIVDCVAVGRDLPVGCTLDAEDVSQRRRAVEEVQKQIAQAAGLGARCAYLVPCKNTAGLPAFADACRVLAEFARRRMVQLCIEHFPGSALPSAAQTLAWLPSTALKLLLDLGHCLISKEDASKVVEQAGDRLGYVQLDDNDGSGDLHWPLLTGALTEAMLRDFLRSLRTAGYRAGIALELQGGLEKPLENAVTSKRIVERLWEEL